MPKDNKPSPVDDDEDATVDVTVVGNAVAVAEAKKAIEKIVGEKAGTTKTKLRGIPSEFYRFIAGPYDTHADSLRNTHNLSELEIPSNYILRTVPQAHDGPIFVPAAADNCITLNGDRAAVLAARAEIERRAKQLHEELTRHEVRGISKGRHQSIIGEKGNPGEDFFATTGCALFVPEKDEQDNTFTIVGPADKIQNAVREARKLSTKSQSATIDVEQHFTGIPNSKEHGHNLSRYLRQRNEMERLERLHNARIYTPNSVNSSIWEIFSGETEAVYDVQGQLMNIMDAHPHSRMANIPVDPFYHKHLEQDISPRVKKDYGVHVVLPDGPNGDVLLVFEGPTGNEPDYSISRGQPSKNDIAQFKRGLEDARKHIIDVISSQAEITSESIDVPKM